MLRYGFRWLPLATFEWINSEMCPKWRIYGVLVCQIATGAHSDVLGMGVNGIQKATDLVGVLVVESVSKFESGDEEYPCEGCGGTWCLRNCGGRILNGEMSTVLYTTLGIWNGKLIWNSERRLTSDVPFCRTFC